MFIHNNNVSLNYLDKNVNLVNNSIEIVDNFKLLGVTIDSTLKFTLYVNNISNTINIKTNNIKRMYFVSQNVRLQFFKSFILPHFDYCSSLFIYFSKDLIDKLNKLYLNCLKKLFKFDFKHLSIEDQQHQLENHGLTHFYNRLFYRLSIFIYKISNSLLCYGLNNCLEKVEN